MRISGLVMMVVMVVQVQVYPLVECGRLAGLTVAAVAGRVLGRVGASCDQAVGGVMDISLAVVSQPGLKGRAAGGSQQRPPALLCIQNHACQHRDWSAQSRQCRHFLCTGIQVLCTAGHACQHS